MCWNAMDFPYYCCLSWNDNKNSQIATRVTCSLICLL